MLCYFNPFNMHNAKKDISKIKFWKNHIDLWCSSSFTQSLYCHKNGLSESVFSKWKKRLHPNLRKNRRYKLKSKYYKFTKLSDRKLEALMSFFVIGASVKKTAETFKVSEKTIYRMNEYFRAAMLDGALNHPQLFFGAGMLVLFGPPNDIKSCLDIVRYIFPNMVGREWNIEIEKNIIRNKIRIVQQMLVYYTLFEWTEAETYLFRQLGFKVFYRLMYAKKNNLDESIWSYELYSRLSNEISAPGVARANWEYWAARKNIKSLLLADEWKAIIHRDRNITNIDKKWSHRMLYDLKWILQKQKIKDTRQIRSNYWDKLQTTSGEKIQLTYEDLTNKFLKLYEKSSVILK